MQCCIFKRMPANDTAKREHVKDWSEWELRAITAFEGKDFPFLIDNDLLPRMVRKKLNA